MTQAFDNSLVQPLGHAVCLLCGGPNGCAVAACGRFDVACWCSKVRFSAELLARVPPVHRGNACICRRCAVPDEAGASPSPAA
jgi:hypothetical protein